MSPTDGAGPRTVDDAFAIFDNELLLDRDERDKAVKRHNEVKDALVGSALIVETFLQGSFRRKTMIKPLNDIDVVAQFYAKFRDELLAPGGAARAFEYIKQPIRERFPTVQFDSGKRPAKALQLTFDDVDFTMDIVVALPDADPQSEDVWIANRDTGEWEKSGTRRLIRLIAERNGDTDGEFIHQVRMIKSAVSNSPAFDGVCGLVVETLAYEVITKKMTHSAACAAILAHAAMAVDGKILDPADRDDLTAKWTVLDRSRYAADFARLSALAAEANRLDAAGDPIGAINDWRDVFGDPFPVAGPRIADKATLLAGMSGGGITRAGDLSPTRAADQTYRPGRSHRAV